MRNEGYLKDEQFRKLAGWAAKGGKGIRFERVSRGVERVSRKSQPLKGWTEGWTAKFTLWKGEQKGEQANLPLGRVNRRVGRVNRRVKSKKSSKSSIKTMKIHNYWQKTCPKIPGWTLSKIQAVYMLDCIMLVKIPSWINNRNSMSNYFWYIVQPFLCRFLTFHLNWHHLNENYLENMKKS